MTSEFQKVFDNYVSIKQQISDSGQGIELDKVDPQILDALCIDTESRDLRESKLFWSDFYIANNRDLQGRDIDAWRHLQSHGLSENRSPHPLIDSKVIESQVPAIGELSSIERYLLDPMFWQAIPNSWTNMNSYLSSGRWDGKRHPILSLLSDPLLNSYLSKSLLAIDSGSSSENKAFAYAYFLGSAKYKQTQTEFRFSSVVEKNKLENDSRSLIQVHPGFGIDSSQGFYPFNEQVTDIFGGAFRTSEFVAINVEEQEPERCLDLVVFDRFHFKDELEKVVDQMAGRETIFVPYSLEQFVALKSICKKYDSRLVYSNFQVFANHLHLSTDLFNTELIFSKLKRFSFQQRTFLLTRADTQQLYRLPKIAKMFRNSALISIEKELIDKELESFIGRGPVIMTDAFLEKISSLIYSHQAIPFSTWIGKKNAR
jgi:hypothetical protein